MNPHDDHMDDAGAELVDFVVSAYRTLQDRWSAAFAEQDCDPAAPWSTLFDRSVPETAPITAGERLLWNAEDTAVVAATGVGHHLGLLARAYWRDPLYPDGLPPSSRWPFTASYACARAVAEGTALVRWLFDPHVDRDERIYRSAVMALWSHPTQWEPLVRDAGFTVAREQRVDGTDGPPFVRVDDTSRPLSQNRLIKFGHGRTGVQVYGRWSPLVHHDPKATFRRTRLRVDPNHGRFLGALYREDEHLEMLAQVAEYIDQAAQQQSGYFGRDATAVTAAADEVRELVAEYLPTIREQVQVRYTRPGKSLSAD